MRYLVFGYYEGDRVALVDSVESEDKDGAKRIVLDFRGDDEAFIVTDAMTLSEAEEMIKGVQQAETLPATACALAKHNGVELSCWACGERVDLDTAIEDNGIYCSDTCQMEGPA